MDKVRTQVRAVAVAMCALAIAWAGPEVARAQQEQATVTGRALTPAGFFCVL